jgi:hypothetical protein
VKPTPEDELHAAPAALELVGQDRRLRVPQDVLAVLLPEPMQHPEAGRVEPSASLGESGIRHPRRDLAGAHALLEDPAGLVGLGRVQRARQLLEDRL